MRYNVIDLQYARLLAAAAADAAVLWKCDTDSTPFELIDYEPRSFPMLNDFFIYTPSRLIEGL